MKGTAQKNNTNRQPPERYGGVETRIQLVAVMMTLAFSLLCVRLWWLQIAHMHEYQERAAAQQVREKRLGADRGVIYGRDNVLLADNRASSDVVFVPGDCPKEQREAVCQRIEEAIGVPKKTLLLEIEANATEPFRQITIKHDVSKADLIRVEELSYALPGVLTVVRPQRRYRYGETGGQILGFLGLAPDALKEDQRYMPSDYVGKAGLELMYEDLLHGEDGNMLVKKYSSGRPQFRTDTFGAPLVAKFDSAGNLLDEFRDQRNDPLPGRPLYLTLDIALQAHCESLLAGERGAIVVLDARSGAVLAMASSPNFDPNVFVDRVPASERMALFEDEARPMLHRAYRDNYAPGSVFKFVMATAALEEGIITPSTTFWCPGSYRPTPRSRSWYCWQHSGHGHVNVEDALTYSCDVFFYNVGEKLGLDRIVKWAHKFSLGEVTGIDLPGEIPALVPTEEWKEANVTDVPPSDRKWFAGDTVNMSIGQGFMLTTPLQNAVMVAALLNGGYRVRPYLNRELGPELTGPIMKQGTLGHILAGGQACVEKDTYPRGTGIAARIEGMHIIGKTGTAQVASLAARKAFTDAGKEIPRALLHHAWFVAGVLDREPRIAVSVLIEHGDSGSHAAAPRARDVIEFFYKSGSSQLVHMAKGDQSQ